MPTMTQEQFMTHLTSSVTLRDVMETDLDIFFEQQLDPEANYMAAFTAEDPTDKNAFLTHWTRITSDDRIINKTILADGEVAGHIASFDQFGKPSVSYWIGKSYWGKGIATSALLAFLDHIKERPLYARAAKDNAASIRVLEKCGFVIWGEDKGFAEARKAEIEEYILELPARMD